jgi:hypothetical protein
VLEVLDRRDELSGESLIMAVRGSQIEKTLAVMIFTELSSFFAESQNSLLWLLKAHASREWMLRFDNEFAQLVHGFLGM